MYGDSQTSRAAINNEGRRLAINIASKYNASAPLFFSLLFFAVVAETIVFIKLIMPHFSAMPELITIYMYFCWIGGDIAAILIVSWYLTGREIITFENDLMKIEKKALGFGLPKEYSLSEIKNLKIVEGSTSETQNRVAFGGNSDGPFAFDYGMKTIRFGLRIQKAEAEQILGTIRDSGYLQDSDGWHTFS